ncbi:PDZ domain-containing protein [uncultured Sphingomonas sp.]|uniref:S41 family peptidase n=1 Tax=uncultured Sphingomonas sp. TaxID=158754 RepID=UPI0025FD3EB1|nr:PDZ domain-containing protein [uncultured Sphingomonas sp.]
MIRRLVAAACACLLTAAADPPPDYASDARALDRLIIENYAYIDRLPGGRLPDSPALAAERDAVRSRDALLHYAEDRIASLADNHAITGQSFRDSWALVPSFTDVWVVRDGDGYVIEAIRDRSPAAEAGIHVGDRLVAVGGRPVAAAVTGFWDRLGLTVTPQRADYAVGVLVAGRRDGPRRLTVERNAVRRDLTLDSLYARTRSGPPVIVDRTGRTSTLRFNDSLGDSATIAAFDTAMAAVPPGDRLVLDLTDTASGGNTSVARAVMGWFVDRPTGYQVHTLPAEGRETGIARQWIEQVLPRAGKRWRGRVSARVGRWTGSMGEGIAIGLDAIGVPVMGTRMAGLLGAVYDFTLPASGLRVKFPAERLWSVSGVPREDFVPKPEPSDRRRTH